MLIMVLHNLSSTQSFKQNFVTNEGIVRINDVFSNQDVDVCGLSV